MESEKTNPQLSAQQVKELIDERISNMEQIAVCHASAGKMSCRSTKVGSRFGVWLRSLFK